MRKKRLLPLLWLATFCMLLVTIVPHHHHLDGRICLHLSEISESKAQKDITHQSDCETDCLTRLIAYRASIGNSDFQSDIFTALPVRTFIFDFSPEDTEYELISAPFRDPGLPDFKGSVSGLRAPPYLI